MRQILCRFGLLICFFAVSVLAQDKPAEQDDVIKIETDLQMFEVTVTDAEGNFVRGLQNKDFKLFEDDSERSIEFFESLRKKDDGRPLSIVFALDVSGSMTADELTKLQTAMNSFISRLANFESTFAIMTFGMQVKTLQSFTNNPKKLEQSLEKLPREPNGLSTHAYDAVDDAIRLLQKKAPQTRLQKRTRRAVIVVTDGFPVGDTVAPKTVIERANQAETTIYTVLLPSFSRLSSNRKPLPTPFELSGIIDKTGGSTFYATDKDFEPLFRALAEEITASYSIAFYPSEEKKRDGRFHNVRIEVGKGYKVKQNRPGYQAQK